VKTFLKTIHIDAFDKWFSATNANASKLNRCISDMAVWIVWTELIGKIDYTYDESITLIDYSINRIVDYRRNRFLHLSMNRRNRLIRRLGYKSIPSFNQLVNKIGINIVVVLFTRRTFFHRIEWTSHVVASISGLISPVYTVQGLSHRLLISLSFTLCQFSINLNCVCEYLISSH